MIKVPDTCTTVTLSMHRISSSRCVFLCCPGLLTNRDRTISISRLTAKFTHANSFGQDDNTAGSSASLCARSLMQSSPTPHVPNDLVLSAKRLTVVQTRSEEMYLYIFGSDVDVDLAFAHWNRCSQACSYVKLNCYRLLQPLTVKYHHGPVEIQIDKLQLPLLVSCDPLLLARPPAPILDQHP
jgi:hypothetical protein